MSLDKSVKIYQPAYIALYKDKQDIGNLAMSLDNKKKGDTVPLIIQVNPSRKLIGRWRAQVIHIIWNEEQICFKFPGAAKLTVQHFAYLHRTSWENPK